MAPDSVAAAQHGGIDGVPVAVILATLLSPLIAVLVTRWQQERAEKQQAKLYLFNTLMATRHTPITEENVRALNMIDVLFFDKPTVRGLWREYFEMLSNSGLDNLEGYKTRQTKNLELINEMAKVLGYGQAISHIDVDRVYYPKGLVQQGEEGAELTRELLRVLRATAGLEVKLQEPPQGEPPAMIGDQA